MPRLFQTPSSLIIIGQSRSTTDSPPWAVLHVVAQPGQLRHCQLSIPRPGLRSCLQNFWCAQVLNAYPLVNLTEPSPGLSSLPLLQGSSVRTWARPLAFFTSRNFLVSLYFLEITFAGLMKLLLVIVIVWDIGLASLLDHHIWIFITGRFSKIVAYFLLLIASSPSRILPRYLPWLRSGSNSWNSLCECAWVTLRMFILLYLVNECVHIAWQLIYFPK